MQIIGFMQQPPLTNCDALRSFINEDQLFSLAFQEFNALKIARQEHALNVNAAVSRTGSLFCFCEHEIKDSNGSVDRFQDYTFTYFDRIHGKDTYDTAPICKVYYQYMTGIGYII